MTKHRLMLSAAAAALLAAGVSAFPAQAQTSTTPTEISTGTSTALTTTGSHSIVIDPAGGIAISSGTVAPVIINSNDYVNNGGTISNDGIAGAVGVHIDTSAGNLVSPSPGLYSDGSISVAGVGTSKVGIEIDGGNTFFGNVTLTTVNAVDTNGNVVAQSASSLVVQGDNSEALFLGQTTKIDGNILIGGTVTQLPSANSTATGSIVFDLDGVMNGNFTNTATVQGIGIGIRGIQIGGGLHSCQSAIDTLGGSAPTGFTCPAVSSGALINAGSIQLGGVSVLSTKIVNPESGSALVVGASIDGGIENFGPGTSSSTAVALLQANGTNAAPTVLIDPAQSATLGLTLPRGPIVIGQITADIDSTDPGYSFINRGTIAAQPADAQVGATAITIIGRSSTYTTSFTGGFLNTGTISAVAQTNQAVITPTPATGLDKFISATALDIGNFTTIPNITVKSETIASGSATPGSITATVSGVGQGTAYGVKLEEGSNVNSIIVGQGATISASVLTSTVAPTLAQAPSSQPFVLTSIAILDQSSHLSVINNGGTISAFNTALSPVEGAATQTTQQAINLSASSLSNIQINNSGQILGDVLLSATGSGQIFNIGNVGPNGGANTATNVTNNPGYYSVVAATASLVAAGQAPATTASIINFGTGLNQTLHIGGYGFVDAAILAAPNALDVQVDPSGALFVANTTTINGLTTTSLNANNFNINGVLGLTIAQNTSGATPVVLANNADISGASLGLQFGTFVSSGYTAASTKAPAAQVITLISAATLTDTNLAQQNAVLSEQVPFLFESPTEAGYSGGVPLSRGTSAGRDTLLLTLLPRSTNALNADGTAGLNLSGDAQNEFPFAARALTNDNPLGSAIASNLTVYNTAGVPSSGINIPASQQVAQKAFSQFAPDVSGGARQVAIMITDQASGPVAARQRLLRSYANQPGEMTLWGEEFTGQINNKGRVDGAGTLTGYKDHGFGFALGMDGGSPRGGWFGGAFTYYTGDVSETQPRASKTDTQWYMLTGYTDWRGRHVFFDTQGSLAFGSFLGNRNLTVGSVSRTAESKRNGEMGALGANLGLLGKFAGIEVDPHVSLDGLVLREEGYTEAGGGDGMDLQVAPNYSNSLRTAVGVDFKTGINMWGVEVGPEARIGYRYDLINTPVKLKAAFVSTGGLGTVNNTMNFVGPDPDTGNAIFGLGVGASTDTWHLGAKYDWIRGNNGSTTQVGMFTLLGRI